jgi:hypothetical protein
MKVIGMNTVVISVTTSSLIVQSVVTTDGTISAPLTGRQLHSGRAAAPGDRISRSAILRIGRIIRAGCSAPPLREHRRIASSSRFSRDLLSVAATGGQDLVSSCRR